MGYLTPRQKFIWDLKGKGLQEASIARKLDVARQTVHKALDIANSKVYIALEESAKLNKIDVKTIDPTRGVLIGYSPEFKTDVVVTFSAGNGIQIWYRQEGDCENCDRLQVCREMLLAEAKDRDIQLPESAGSILPSKLTEALFLKITGE
jgi:hypothetical protein